MGGSGAAFVIVVGAGVFGLATGLALAEAGLKVRLFAETAPRDTASGVAAGMLAPAFETLLDPPSTDALDLFLAARDLWPALSEGLGLLLDRSGTAAAGEAEWVERLEAGFAARGLKVARAGGRELKSWAPGLNPALGAGLVTPEDWRIEPRVALAAMVRRLAELGGRLETRRVVAADLDAGAPVVLATGPSRELVSLAPELVRLSPIKGQILWRGDRPAPTRVIRTEGAYVLGSEGGMLAGATMEAGRLDTEPDPGAQAGLRRAVASLLDVPVGGWETRVGVRAATSDGLPLAGPSSRPGVFLAAGARRNGWLLAPLVARIVTAAVTDEDGGPWAGRLSPGRLFSPGGGGGV
ncbi:MAG: NAD(P)/FAD-dependent oxidoreductase [Phenylobacterium sp.]